jgi:phosphoenolpyruvate synthase/pyruvate phosphate dikinase
LKETSDSESIKDLVRLGSPYSIYRPSIKPYANVLGMKRIGEGLITLNLSAEGELRIIKSVQDVITLWKEGASGKIVMVDDAGITTLGPILPKLAGVVCMSGGLGSHLAIVTREFSIPALMGTKMKTLENIHKKKVQIRPSEGENGELLLIE